MKFIQTGDIHVGECRTLKNYLHRHQDVLAQITETAIDRNLPLIVAGDVFHTKNTTHEERCIVEKWIGTLEKHKVKSIFTAGNHDHLSGEFTQLEGLSQIGLKHVKIVGWHPQTCAIDESGFICISWGNYKRDDIEKIVRNHLPVIESYKYRTVILHECITGVKLDSGMVLSSGCSIPENIPEITYWAVGDIHKMQRTNVPNSWYAGAPAQFTFGDKLPKGIIVVDLENPSEEPEFIPMKFKPLVTVSKVSEIKDDAYYRVVGSFDEVIKANEHDSVVKTQIQEKEETVAASEENDESLVDESSVDEEEIKVSDENTIFEGLASHLAKKGLSSDYQQKGIEFVRSVVGEN